MNGEDALKEGIIWWSNGEAWHLVQGTGRRKM